MSSQNWVLWCSEEFDNIEDRMELVHGVGKVEAVGIFSDSAYNWVRL
jgi:hypothetical protein